MRKVILNLAVTLDGFIEGPNGEYDWCFTDQDYGMQAFLERTGIILLGRKSYEVLQTMEGDSFPDHEKYVFSRTLQTVNAPYQLVAETAETAVARLKTLPGKDLWLFGGAGLTAGLLNAGLVDELMLSVHPLLLGSGKLLFTRLQERMPFKLLRSELFSTGLVQLHYERPEQVPIFAR